MKNQYALWGCLCACLIACCCLWSITRSVKPQWRNVPSPPLYTIASTLFLGDDQLAYRSFAVVLQNMGDMGGRVTPLKDYDQKNLAKWFFLMDKLDPRSDYIPYLAAFYFGAADHGDSAKNLRPLIDYLHAVGVSDQGQKWRWLAHAIHLARFKLHDLDYAYDMAVELSDMAHRRTDKQFPHWARQMPAFVLNAQGEKQAAFELMMNMLSSSGDAMHPSEVRYTVNYICTQILTQDQVRDFPLCQS